MRALVTGGGRGIGRALARALTREGWTVAVTGRDGAVLQDAVDAGDAATALPGDTTSWDDVSAAASGELDLVVANAGRFATGGPLWESDPDDWWRDVEVNLRGVALLARAALPGMVARGRGRFVALGSGFGNASAPHGSGYGVSKAAVHRLVESLADELAGTGVSAFTLSPGRVRTDMQLGFPRGLHRREPGVPRAPGGRLRAGGGRRGAAPARRLGRPGRALGAVPARHHRPRRRPPHHRLRRGAPPPRPLALSRAARC